MEQVTDETQMQEHYNQIRAQLIKEATDTKVLKPSQVDMNLEFQLRNLGFAETASQGENEEAEEKQVFIDGDVTAQPMFTTPLGGPRVRVDEGWCDGLCDLEQEVDDIKIQKQLQESAERRQRIFNRIKVIGLVATVTCLTGYYFLRNSDVQTVKKKVKSRIFFWR